MYVLIFECKMLIIDFASADDCLIILLTLKFVSINEYDFCQISRIEFSLHIQYCVYELNILSISTMNNEVKRVFSEACYIIFWERAQLNVKTLKCIKCLKHWKWSKLLHK